MSSADPLVRRIADHLQVVAAEVGSARLEQAEPDSEVVTLADEFAGGALTETDFEAAVERHQRALLIEAQERSVIVGVE